MLAKILLLFFVVSLGGFVVCARNLPNENESLVAAKYGVTDYQGGLDDNIGGGGFAADNDPPAGGFFSNIFKKLEIIMKVLCSKYLKFLIFY